MDPGAEARQGAAHELFALDVVDPAGALAVAITLQWSGRAVACSITLAGRDRPLTMVVEPDAGTPRGLELRAPGLWLDLQCLVPFDHVTVDVEAFALALDAPPGLGPADAEPRGERVPFGLELEWDTAPDAAPVLVPVADGASGHELACQVHGLVLVGDERLEIDGFGSRRHLWGPVPPWAVPWARTVGAAGVRDAWPARPTVVAHAPLAVRPAGRPALVVDRALARVDDPEPSYVWIERNLPC